MALSEVQFLLVILLVVKIIVLLLRILSVGHIQEFQCFHLMMIVYLQ